jgi:hypothetical protein
LKAGVVLLRAQRATEYRVAVGVVVVAGDRRPNPKAGAVLDRQPGRQQPPQLDDHEEKQEHEGQNHGELDKPLPPQAPAG